MTKMEFLLKINGGYERGARAKIAKMLGITLSSVSGWFSDREKPSMQNIDKMARIFDIPSEEIYEAFYGQQKPANYFFADKSQNIKGNNNTQTNATNADLELIKKDMEVFKQTLENLNLRLKILEKDH